MSAVFSKDARQRLEKLGVEIRLNAPVTAVDAAGVTMGTARIEARTVIWARLAMGIFRVSARRAADRWIPALIQ